MNLLNVLREECILARQDCADKEAVLNLVAATAKQSSLLAKVDEATILAGLTERESLGSTGFGKGIAIPHCRLEDIEDFVVGLISLPQGVEFESLDHAPVHLVAFIIAPQRQTDEHIRLLSAISQTLTIPGATQEMIAEPTGPALYESFARYTRDEVKESEVTPRTLFHVFVEEEQLFRELLQMLTGIAPDTVMVFEGQQTGSYLSKLPLFAGFWGDNTSQLMHVILATVEKRLTNETIRRIESITGPLQDRTDIMVTAQEIFFCAGGIGA